MRDEFAAKAMVGLLSHYGVEGSNEDCAKASYAIADAMLEERGK